MGALSGRADVFAKGRVRALSAELGAGFGSRVGNRLAALPPGFRREPGGGMLGRLPTGSAEVIDTGIGVVSGDVGDFAGVGEVFGVGGAVRVTVADAMGSFDRLAVLPVTVRRTDVTVEAVTGVVSCAWSCRCGAVASSGPRSQEEVPSSLPQPKLNPGVPPSAGVACSCRVASGRFPPVVQALMVHRAACPRSLLACELVISTQRLACATCITVVAVFVLVAVPVAVGVPVDVGVGVAAGVAVAEVVVVLVGDADGDGLLVGSGLLCDGVAVGVVVGLLVGSGLLFVAVGVVVRLVESDGDELDVWPVLVLVLGLVLGVGDVAVGVGVGVVVGVVLGVVVGAVGVGDGLGI
jgi:hypothetical protein